MRSGCFLWKPQGTDSYVSRLRGRCPDRRVFRRKEDAMVDLPSQPLGDIDPEFQKIALETGDWTYSLSGTSTRQKLLINLANDVCREHLGLAFRLHVQAALSHGVPFADLLGVVRFIGPYAGYPAAADALERLGAVAAEFGIDLRSAAAEVAGRFLARASEEGVRLEVELPAELPVCGDPGRAGQILAAVLDNAVRHTPEGGTVTLSGRRLHGGAEASVTDTGSGIVPEHLPHVFDRFYRAEEARTRKGGGTGLGLAIARDLARAQDGELSAENAVGGGATFRLRLPIHDGSSND